jgi:hypothetical protein
MSIYLKACRRCRGDLFFEHDSQSDSGWACLQCGWRGEKAEILNNYRVLAGENRVETSAIRSPEGCSARGSVHLLHNRNR